MENPTMTFNGAYPNCPQVAVGAIVFKEDKVLLVLRGKPPAVNLWSIPGGSVELGETLQEATEREIREEAGITIRAREPVYTFDVLERDNKDNVRFHYVIVDLAADYISGELRPGDDAIDVRWFSADEVNKLKVSEATRKLLNERFGFGL
jgi:ADP-ribose pyrophosphatase